MYWTQGDQKVLVTEITHSSIPTPRQVKNGDIYLGQVDKYWGRSYTRECNWSHGHLEPKPNLLNLPKKSSFLAESA
jgi:hypothetical protein